MHRHPPSRPPVRRSSGGPPPPRPGGDDGKSILHPRSRHRARYDFPALIRACPELAGHVAVNAYGDASIDFADPVAVRRLNTALLKHFYGIDAWDIPPGFLCPPVPGRADHIHYAADFLAAANGGAIPRGGRVRILDIGVGANAIYPLIGHREYGWSFVGSDIDPAALASAARIIGANHGLGEVIHLRHQTSASRIFAGIVHEGEAFDLVLCNPPFHASPEAARAGTVRKLRNLGLAGRSSGRDGRAKPPALNFGGHAAELWCPGGEAAFVGRMISESAAIPTACRWFTSLVAQAAHLPAIRAALTAARVRDVAIIDMAQGVKKSRLVAWTFLDGRQATAWRRRWAR